MPSHITVVAALRRPRGVAKEHVSEARPCAALRFPLHRVETIYLRLRPLRLCLRSRSIMVSVGATKETTSKAPSFYLFARTLGPTSQKLHQFLFSVF
jgi:hypothetical protein